MRCKEFRDFVFLIENKRMVRTTRNHLSNEELKKLINEQDESEILDYKENFEDAKAIGEYISALGNSALMLKYPVAYLIWGVQDTTKKIVGTKFNPVNKKASSKNKMPFKTYLEQYLDPRVNLFWEEHNLESKRIVVLIIDIGRVNHPISFMGKRFIRVGTSKKSLSEFPEKERMLWNAFESTKFESKTAIENVSFENLANLLDLSTYSKITGLPLGSVEIINEMLKDNLIRQKDANFDITNLGAYTLAKNMEDFSTLRKRTIRITQYAGKQKLDKAVYDKQGKIGIAISFNNVIENIMNHIPYTENYSEGSRKDVPRFPKIAIRELVANALVHQDFTIEGMCPTVEIFSNKIVFSSPGVPLIAPERFLDVQPISRNNDLANLIGKFNIVESRGTGIDKAVFALEKNQLPALDIKVPDSRSTVVTVRAKKAFKDMSITERNSSIYWNACLRYVADEQVSNKSLRDSFKLTSRDSSLMSKAIASAVEANLIKVYDPNVGRKFSRYIPYWGTDVLNN